MYPFTPNWFLILKATLLFLMFYFLQGLHLNLHSLSPILIIKCLNKVFWSGYGVQMSGKTFVGLGEVIRTFECIVLYLFLMAMGKLRSL